MAFQWERAGVSNLYVVPADGSTAARALTTDDEQVAGLFWATDSGTLYFTRDGMLMEVSASGEDAPRPVWSQMPGRGLSPSPDGSRVAYVSGGAGRGGGGGPSEIRVRSLVDDSDRVVARTAAAIDAVGWTPDGLRLTLSSGGGRQSIRHEQTPEYSGARRHLYVATIGDDPATAVIRQVTTGRGTNIDPEWSPDGTKLVYQHTDPESPADLFVIDATAEGALPVVSERDQGLRTSVM